MKFSLILATLGRTNELERFLSSLDRQTCRNFELIVVDQNPDDRLAPILAPYQAPFPIIHLRSTRGNSRARNVGLAHIRGQIVAFPDDDCWYSPDLLETVARFFDSHPETAGLCGRCVNGRGVPRGRWDSAAGPVTKMTLFKRSGAVSMFFTRRAIERIGGFDETLGLGQPTPWQGGEDLDYVARAVKSGSEVYYRPDLDVYHDDPPPIDERSIMRARSGSRASGRLLRIHNYPLWYLAYWLAGSLALVLISTTRLDLTKARYHWVSFVGKLEGWLARSNAVADPAVPVKQA
jgi:glycosyltransferase involved in cell wall biosynthesis